MSAFFLSWCTFQQTVNTYQQTCQKSHIFHITYFSPEAETEREIITNMLLERNKALDIQYYIIS
jgi:hypothetical protein